jgi:hypothetical protein
MNKRTPRVESIFIWFGLLAIVLSGWNQAAVLIGMAVATFVILALKEGGG